MQENFQSIVFTVLFVAVMSCGQLLMGQSSNTTLLSNWDDDELVYFGGIQYNDIWGYAATDGREYAILGSADFTHFIDISDPNNPVEVDREAGASRCIWRDYKTFRNYAYAVSDNCGGSLQIFDLSSLPDSVDKVFDSDVFFDDVHNIFIDTMSARLYAAGYTGGGSVDVIVLDLSDSPDKPTMLKAVDLVPGYVHDLFVRNDTAYCSHGSSGALYIYNFEDLDNILVLGALTSYTGQGYNHSSWVSEDRGMLVLADENHGLPVKVVDVSNPDDLSVLGTFQSALLAPDNTSSIVHNPFIIGNEFVVLSYYHDGIQIYSLADSAQPFRAGYYDTFDNDQYNGFQGAWGAYPYLPSGVIIGSDVDNGLFVIEPHFPLRPCAEDVLVKGNYDRIWTVSSKDVLHSQAVYSANSVIDYTARTEITLLPGFEAGSGSSMVLEISDGCN